MPEVLEHIYDVKQVVMKILNKPRSEVVSADLPRLVGIESNEPAHDALGDARAVAAALRQLRHQKLI